MQPLLGLLFISAGRYHHRSLNLMDAAVTLSLPAVASGTLSCTASGQRNCGVLQDSHVQENEQSELSGWIIL